MKRAAGLLALIAVIVGGAIVYVARPQGEVQLQKAPRGGSPAFSPEGLVATGASKARFSADGTRLAVLTSDGAGIVEDGLVEVLTPPESIIADLAWMTGTSELAVVQSPVADRIALINADGSETGFVPLDPPLQVGSGTGFDVDSSRRRALLGVEERPALGPVARHLVLVDLQTGQSRGITPQGGPDEVEPFWVGDDTIMFTRITSAPSSADEPTQQVVLLDLASGDTTELTRSPVRARGVGVVGTVPVYSTGSVVVADAPTFGEQQTLYEVGASETVIAVDPSGGRIVVAERLDTGSRLREQEIPAVKA